MSRIKPVASIERVTPSIAKEWMEKNTGNRDQNVGRIDKLAEDFREGKHPITNDAIAFDIHEVLWNGQHRLQAIVSSGVSIDCLVIRGTDPEAFMFADTGMKRSGGQALKKLGYENNTSLSALAGAVKRWNDGRFFGGTYAITPNEIADIVRENPILVEIVIDAGRIRGRKRIPWRPQAIGMAIYISHLSKKKAEFLDFLDRACSGANLSQGSPVLALRNRFMSPTPPGRDGMIHETALLLKAFLWEQEGRRKTLLQWRDDEEFPSLGGKKGKAKK
jgi:hypothetical protein